VRILTRYILGEIFSHTLIGCALFTFILFMRDLPHILEMVVRNSSSFVSVFQVFLFTMPETFMVTIPMAVLVGVLLGLGRLASDSEITAMRASGLGIGYFLRVASIIAVSGTIIGLFNSLYVAPRANQAILDLEQSLATSQASYEIQPRVFIEEFKNSAIYVQDVRAGAGANNWRQIFMADLTDPSAPKITTAESATVVNDNSQVLLMRLRNGAEHEMGDEHDQYNVSTFSTTDRPLVLSPQSDIHLGRVDTPIYAMPNAELLTHTHDSDGRRYELEFHKRFAYPAACLVLMLVGVPLGAASRRGGKSSGFVLTIILVFLYYFLSSTGIALGRQNKIPAFLAVWAANMLFAAAGSFLLWQMARGGNLLNALTGWMTRTPKETNGSNGIKESQKVSKVLVAAPFIAQFFRSKQRIPRTVFPRILDEYVIREFLTTFVMVLSGFVLLMLVFTGFELVGDILRNHIPLSIVGAYLFNLTPSMIYAITPLGVLIAVLVTFGVLNRNSELVAMKATGISIYRLVIPILLISATLATGLFLFDQYYLPQANRKQEALRSTIKGRPPRTFLNPEQQWIFGQQQAGQPSHIFYYKLFDSDKQEFVDLSLFEFDPVTFSISRRVFAEHVIWNAETSSWDFENGWQRDLIGANTKDYREFLKAQFSEIHEDPSYFKKENLQSQEMNFGQLEHYIADLQQSGFDTMRLRVELWHKIAYPFVTIIMAMLAIPFALAMGRRGSLTSIAVAIGVALAYWVVQGLFEAMGNVNYLPALVAAWSPDILFGLAGGYLLLRTPT
jgi:LPS export ABC transporter permease LptG/LPS export ABC transporter permease LptF